MQLGTTYLSDPATAGPLTHATAWIQAVVLGSVASVIAVLAVATLGLLLMSGRVDLRRGLTTICGCFILFGAGTIAQALFGLAGQNPEHVEPSAALPAAPPIPVQKTDTHYDPYAGASYAPPQY